MIALPPSVGVVQLSVTAWAVPVPATGVPGTVATGGATACKVGNQPTLAAMQVASGAVFYSLHSATATPSALNYAATGGDVLLIHRPDRFRVISQAAGTVNLIVTCFQE